MPQAKHGLICLEHCKASKRPLRSKKVFGCNRETAFKNTCKCLRLQILRLTA